MPIYSLTKERIEKLRIQARDKEKELLRLLERTPKSMWLANLGDFEKAWEVRSSYLFFDHSYVWLCLQLGCQELEKKATGGNAKGKKESRNSLC